MANWPPGQRVCSSTSVCAPPSMHQPGRPRLGQPAAGDPALLVLLERRRVVLADDGDVTGAGAVLLESLPDEPGAQRDVLGVAGLRVGQRLALELRRAR